MLSENPCLHCGACCATFRVSFHWEETEPSLGGEVPIELTEDLPPFWCCMKGTNQKSPHCAALVGKVGEQVSCSIYERRSSTCREFGVHVEGEELFIAAEELAHCNQARAHWGLPPLTGSPIQNKFVLTS